MSDLKEENGISRRGPQVRGEKTRLRILEVALSLIARRGAGSLRVREVAGEAGISLGVLTYHFPTRDSLLTAAFVHHLERTDSEGVSLGESHGPAMTANALGLDQMTDIVMEMLRRMVSDDRDVFLAGQELTLEITRNAELSERVRPALAAHRNVIEDLMAAVGSDAPGLDGELLSATFEGLGLKWIVHPDDPEFEERLRASVRRLLGKFLFASAV
jgi:TetR/AcrR family transcriptional regulator, regulator of biofilm formation and stress response